MKRQRSRPWLGWIAPAVVLIVAGAVTVVSLRDSEDAALDPIEISADGPTFSTLDELFAASDVVVEATVVAVDEGRTISDPANPTTGLVTSLARLDVERVFAGGDVGVLIVEQEAALLDGTPIIVNGVAPNEPGQSGFWFLVAGGSDEFPYLALVNEQARILRRDDRGSVDVVGFEGVDQRSADEMCRLLDGLSSTKTSPTC